MSSSPLSLLLSQTSISQGPQSIRKGFRFRERLPNLSLFKGNTQVKLQIGANLWRRQRWEVNVGSPIYRFRWSKRRYRGLLLPTCPSCSKPLEICLCAKLKHHSGSLLLENQVSVTILQHNLETKHPLNSARIAKIGIKNVCLHTVFDVLSDARFVIQFPTSIVTMKILKGGAVVDLNCCESMAGFSNFDEVLASPSAKDGFTVQKLSRRKMNDGDFNQEEHQEFELKIPAGTVLLYPSEESVRFLFTFLTSASVRTHGLLFSE